MKLFKKNHRFANKYLFYLVGLTTILSCTDNSPENDNKTVFRYNELGGITSLDPAAARTLENCWAVNQLFNGLVQTNDSLVIKPCIARKWDISADGLTYTFYLRSDVFFHNNKYFKHGKGRKVTAHDFVYSFNRLLNPSVSSALSLLSSVDTTNHRAFNAENDSVFVIRMKKAFVPFLNILAMKYFSVVPHEVVEGYGSDFGRNPVGSGPFKFKVWKDGNKMVFVKNKNYFEFEGHQRLPYLDAISISFIKSKESAFFSFMEGKLDMLSGIDAINTDKTLTEQGQLKEELKNKFILQKQASLKTDYLGFLIDINLEQVKKSPLRILALRQAINHAFDRTKMVKYLRKNIGIAATGGIIPPGLPSFNPKKIKGYEYNPSEVRRLMEQAGFPQGKGLPEIKLATTEQYMELAEYVQSQLREFGINVKIDVQKSSVLSKAISNNEILFFRKSWVADYPSEENFLSLFYSKNFSPEGFNYTHFKNNQFDKLYELAQVELNDVVRYKYYQQMDSLMISQAPIIPLYYDEVIRLTQNNISGLTTNAMNMLSLVRVKKTE